MRCHCNIIVKLSLLLWMSPIAIMPSKLDKNFIIYLSEPFLNASILQQICISYSVITLFIFKFVYADEVTVGQDSSQTNGTGSEEIRSQQFKTNEWQSSSRKSHLLVIITVNLKSQISLSIGIFTKFRNLIVEYLLHSFKVNG